jgi:hypothetical protein
MLLPFHVEQSLLRVERKRKGCATPSKLGLLGQGNNIS